MEQTKCSQFLAYTDIRPHLLPFLPAFAFNHIFYLFILSLQPKNVWYELQSLYFIHIAGCILLLLTRISSYNNVRYL